MIMTGNRARQLELNESAGDIIIVKAVVLAPNYVPKNLIDPLKIVSSGVHVIYNAYVWNVPTSSVSKGICKSHNDLIEKNHIPEDKVIGYFVKEGATILEHELDNAAKKILSSAEIQQIEHDLTKLRW